MSQASKALNKIAASEEYKALDEAIKAANWETMAKSYVRLGGLMEEEKKQILEKINSLPRQNKDEDCEKFQAAFAIRASITLPQWYWLDSQLKEAGVMEGEVFGFGTLGDPLVRTREGRVVVIRGNTLEKGAKIRFKVVTEGPKLDFGRLIELTPEYFSSLLNREARTGIKKSFDAVEECLKNRSIELNESGLSQLSELLKGLEEARELANKLEAVEREATVARILAYRKRLLNEYGVKLAFEFMSREETREIVEACQGDGQQVASALAASGFFRYQAHQALRARLLTGEGLKGYSEILKNLESKVDSMDAALELMEFQSGVEKVSPSAKAYLERIDRLFDRLNRKAREVALAIAEGRISSQDINSAIREAFSGAALGVELRRTFRSAGEFAALRGALADLMTMLGDSAGIAAESAIKPYLTRKIASAFEEKPENEG